MAVFTPLDSSQMQAVLALYDVGDYQGHEGILEGVENTNFKVSTTQGQYILTLFESRTNVADLPFFFAYTDHLVQKGISCPGPLTNCASQRQTDVSGRKAALFPFLSGKSLPVSALQDHHAYEVGQITARMHKAVADFKGQRENPLSLAGWQKLADKTRDRAGEVVSGLASVIDEELSWLADRWPHNLPAGAVHLDIFPDNVFFQDDRLSAVIDFYFSATDYLAYDLAIVINAWCFDESYAFKPTMYEGLMRGYQELRPLSGGERAALPVLLRGASIRFLMTRLHDWVFHDPASFVKPHDPLAYLARLKFHQSGNIPL
ncbi:MAG: homoserine kinase [Micavibrio sp.]